MPIIAFRSTIVVSQTLFVILPYSARKPCGGCDCRYCKQTHDKDPQWDTLAIGADGHTWTVHAPELRMPGTPGFERVELTVKESRNA